MTAKRKCHRCKKKEIASTVKHAKYCLECRLELRQHPKHNLSKEQIKKVIPLIGKYSRVEIAKKLKVSVSDLQRYGKEHKLSFSTARGSRKYFRDPRLIKEVLDYYVKNGKIATAKKFPRVSIRSIVERYAHAPRQIRWTNPQLLDLLKMAGLISFPAQAKYFNRPRANAGSITSVWFKKLRYKYNNIHGLPNAVAKRLVTKRPIPIKVRYFNTLYLWCDIAKVVRPELPEYIKDAIKAIADLQRKIFKTDNPRQAIIKMINKIEIGEWKDEERISKRRHKKRRSNIQ